MTPPTPRWFSRSVMSRSDSEVARRSRTSWPTSGRVWLEKAWMPGPRVADRALRAGPCCCSAERRVGRRSLISGRPSRSSMLVVVPASWPIRSAASPAWRIATRASASVAAISGPRSASERLTASRLSRMPAIDSWLRSDEQFGQPLGQRRDALEQFRRGVEQLRRARPAWSGSPARHRGIRPAHSASGQRIVAARRRGWPGAALAAGRSGSGRRR